MTIRNDPEITKIAKRIILGAQNTGRCSKSTTAATLYEHHLQRKIDVHAVDCDGDHKSLSSAYPGDVNLFEIRNDVNGAVDALNLISAAPAGVTIIDQRAHQKQQFLRAISQIVDDPAVRFTFLIWPQEESEVLMDIHSSVKQFGNRVDWLVVYNPARSATFRWFQNSPLVPQLKDFGAGFMEIPLLFPDTLKHIAACALKKGRKAIPFRDVILPANPWEVQMGHRGFLQDWLRTVFAAYDQNIHLLCLPSDLQQVRKEIPQYKKPHEEQEGDLSWFNPTA